MDANTILATICAVVFLYIFVKVQIKKLKITLLLATLGVIYLLLSGTIQIESILSNFM